MNGWDDILEPWRNLVEINVPGRTLLVPENNLFLRCFQYAEPQRIPYGDFCWNAQCGNCRCVLKRDGQEQEILCCQKKALQGDEVTDLSDELARCLRTGETR